MTVSLIGDSVFDNSVYIAPDELDTIGHLKQLLRDDDCELLAVDGSITSEVTLHQLPRIDRESDWIVVSSGGNDALSYSYLLDDLAESVLDDMFAAKKKFHEDYSNLLSGLMDFDAQVIVCTVYSGAFDEQRYRRKAAAAISVFNDTIYRLANRRGLPVIELRSIFTSVDDYANPIEPSTIGSEKLARAIVDQIHK